MVLTDGQPTMTRRQSLIHRCEATGIELVGVASVTTRAIV